MSVRRAADEEHHDESPDDRKPTSSSRPNNETGDMTFVRQLSLWIGGDVRSKAKARFSSILSLPLWGSFIGVWSQLPQYVVGVSYRPAAVGMGAADCNRDLMAGGLASSRRLQSMQSVYSSTDHLLKNYTSFEEYALELSVSGQDWPPIPVVASSSNNPMLTIPAAILIGSMKAGTTSLASSISDHPQLYSFTNTPEVHFFDERPGRYPVEGEWPGDGRGNPTPHAVASTLSAYSMKLAHTLNLPRTLDKMVFAPTPTYLWVPLAPYRMRIIYPQAKLVVLLRDPTERYLSEYRMCMCRRDFQEDNPRFFKFHFPGNISGYLEDARAHYSPYSPLCRGESATADDLRLCSIQMTAQSPLFRGLYAEQLERWFRVYDRSQILIVNSADMYADMSGTLSRVSKHIGLSDYHFSDESVHQYATSEDCNGHQEANRHRYEQMLEDKGALREFYRPHNERLYDLIGTDMHWA